MSIAAAGNANAMIGITKLDTCICKSKDLSNQPGKAPLEARENALWYSWDRRMYKGVSTTRDATTAVPVGHLIGRHLLIIEIPSKSEHTATPASQIKYISIGPRLKKDSTLAPAFSRNASLWIATPATPTKEKNT